MKRRRRKNEASNLSAKKHVKSENPLLRWTATDRPLKIPPDNLSHVPSTGTSINIFVRGVGVGVTHTKNLTIKKLREVREINGLELDQEGAKPTIGRHFKTKFEIPNIYSDKVLITDSDFILSDKTSAICITADMSFNTRLEADFNCGVSVQEETRVGGNGSTPSFSFTSSR